MPKEYEKFIDKFLKYKFEQKIIDLFSQYENIYLCQQTLKDILREQLCEIIIKLCGHVTSRPNRATLIISGDKPDDKNSYVCSAQKSVPIVRYEWILS